MRCMTKTKYKKKMKANNEEYHNLVPEMARVGIQIRHVTYGVLQIYHVFSLVTPPPYPL